MFNSKCHYELQSKAVRHHCIPAHVVKTQTLATPNADEDEEQQELSFTNGGNTERYRWWEHRMVQMWEYGMVQMVGIRNGTDGGNTERCRWWKYGMVQMVGIQKGTDGGNTEWYSQAGTQLGSFSQS